MTQIDEYAPWEAMAKDAEFWAGFQKELETALSDRLLPVFMAGAYAGARLLPKRLRPDDLEEQKHYSGQHDQRTHAHGGFGSPAIGTVTELQAKNAEKWLAKNGLTRETIDANAEAFYRKATARQTREGMGWYDGAHDYASDLATKHGVSVQTATGVLAACSPRTLWSKNKEEADAILGLVKRGPIGGPMKVGSVTGDNLDKALKIARGGDPEKILGGSKVRSFYHNILEPHASRETTIDTHMINALAGGGHPVSEVLTRAVFKRPAVYSIFKDSVDRVAAKRGIRRSQAQAILWTVQMEAVGLKALRLALKAEDDDYEEPAEGTGLYDAGDEGLSDAEYLAKLEHDMRARGETEDDIRAALGDVVLYSTGRTLVQKHLQGRHDQMTHAHGSLRDTYDAYPSPSGWTKRMDSSSMNDRMPHPFTKDELTALPEDTRKQFTEAENRLVYQKGDTTVVFSDALKTPDRGPNWTTPPEGVEAALSAIDEVSSKNPLGRPADIQFRTGTELGGGGWTITVDNKTMISIDTHLLRYPTVRVADTEWARGTPRSVARSNATALQYVTAHEWGHGLETPRTLYGIRALHEGISPYAVNARKNREHEAFAELFTDFYFGGASSTPLARTAAKDKGWKR